MKKFQFKTNINCSGCIAKVKPFMDASREIKQWEVDTGKPEKVLTVETEVLTDKEIENIVKNAGYKAEKIN
jgi:copper chaperone